MKETALGSYQQLGLLAGSFMSWEEDRENPQQLKGLVWWALELPSIDEKQYPPLLGVSAAGFALIYYTILLPSNFNFLMH